MGLFGSSKKGTDPSNFDYEDIENLPLAVAVVPDNNGYQNQIVPSPKQGAYNNNSSNSKRGRAVSPMPMVPMTFNFTSRIPTIVPQCPVCMKMNVRTRTTTAPDWMTWVTVAVLLVTFWPLCWIPLVTDSCRRTIHYCTSCHGEVGAIRPFKDCCVKHR